MLLPVSQRGEVPNDIAQTSTYPHRKKKKTVSRDLGTGSQSRYLQQHLRPGTEPWANHDVDKLYEKIINIQFWHEVAGAGGRGWQKEEQRDMSSWQVQVLGLDGFKVIQ